MTIQYGQNTIHFNIVFTNRKTLGINVFADQSVTVRAPQTFTTEKVCSRVQKRARWIVKQQRKFASFPNKASTKQYVSGETFRYLGRQYRLKVIEDIENTTKLLSGYLCVYVQDKTNKTHIQKLTETWYRKHAQIQFQKRLDLCYQKLRKYDIAYPNFTIRKMKNRWGSFTPNGRIFLNLKLIEMPTYCIDYVITHELCHSQHPNHSHDFYTLLNRIMPEWPQIKHRLESFS